jgi:mannose-6-phosphate isomerase-like protein (cupin superfamily)
MRFDIPAGVAHAVKNTGTAPMVLVGFNTVAITPEDPNTVREVILES